MVVVETPFDPQRDIKAVEPFGFVDLQNAFVHGVIESNIADTEESYNGIEDPTVVLGKPRDVFDAMQARINAENAANSSEEKKAE